ncbi:MAG: ADP-ribosylglycohydrolase family protein [Clostridia bacterium]|nr:ADP-ribosylglycohydrolase family protein [Clostridia bacterium]
MDMLKRYRGCLLAGGIGDQLGNDVEFMRRSEMLAMYGEDGVHTMSRHITDDTQMTLFTAEGMLLGRKHAMPMPACVYQSYLDWYATQMYRAKGGVFGKESALMKEERLHARRAPGNTCLGALGSGDMGLIDEAINGSKGCGGVMRTAPCGLLKMLDTPDPEDAYAMQGAQAGAITHGHMMGWVPAAMLADMVHMIVLEDGRTLKQIALDSLQRMTKLFGTNALMQGFEQLMKRAVALAETDVPADRAIAELGEGWVGDEALAVAVYCALKYQDDMEACLSAAVTHDGDSDSTGAIAGNILGAWLGADGIPDKWLEQLELREVINGMACRLYAAANE